MYFHKYLLLMVSVLGTHVNISILIKAS